MRNSSANIQGGTVLHVLTGNLSHQIEHHLFPDLPSNRYAEIAPRVHDVLTAHGIPYTTGPLLKQYASTWARICRMALPNLQRTAPARPRGEDAA
ncbi:fatty acid desaturase family protein [Streptomyces poonensis]|uniref:Fatty acid desaturase domain-containing protein n=1 Tax=Streptomyces poonensis TaxID=68255 RepID=A0A918PT02_9ACTN|nr:fatty acid desaturase [Streptomyces poonensis]GGZ20946.1 hypothetical protein GCM10010365_46610 [Streptomyces poonensis]